MQDAKEIYRKIFYSLVETNDKKIKLAFTISRSNEMEKVKTNEEYIYLQNNRITFNPNTLNWFYNFITDIERANFLSLINIETKEKFRPIYPTNKSELDYLLKEMNVIQNLNNIIFNKLYCIEFLIKDSRLKRPLKNSIYISNRVISLNEFAAKIGINLNAKN